MNVSKAVIFHDEREGTPGSIEAENKNPPNGPSYTQEKDLVAVGSKTGPKSKNSNKKIQKGGTANKSDDDQQACRGSEGHDSSSRKGLEDDGDANRRRQLSFGGTYCFTPKMTNMPQHLPFSQIILWFSQC